VFGDAGPAALAQLKLDTTPALQTFTIKAKKIDTLASENIFNSLFGPTRIRTRILFRYAAIRSIIKRFASTEEVANMVVYVCSQQASATIGGALRVDGGVVRFVA
jgi:enoyl-[acyl-carrier-protein] reductase (NADH)